ncbi:ABC transporter ATP-binding protein, partial [Streptomyces sp. NPDC057654]
YTPVGYNPADSWGAQGHGAPQQGGYGQPGAQPNPYAQAPQQAPQQHAPQQPPQVPQAPPVAPAPAPAPADLNKRDNEDAR